MQPRSSWSAHARSYPFHVKYQGRPRSSRSTHRQGSVAPVAACRWPCQPGHSRFTVVRTYPFLGLPHGRSLACLVPSPPLVRRREGRRGAQLLFVRSVNVLMGRRAKTSNKDGRRSWVRRRRLKQRRQQQQLLLLRRHRRVGQGRIPRKRNDVGVHVTLMTWIEMPFLSTSANDVTSPSQFYSTIVRRRTTTALAHEASSTSLLPVQALPSSIEAPSVMLFIVEGRKRRKPLERAPRFGLKRPHQRGRLPGPTTPAKFVSAARSIERGRKQPSMIEATPKGDTNE
jgi:hypothetical protein